MLCNSVDGLEAERTVPISLAVSDDQLLKKARDPTPHFAQQAVGERFTLVGQQGWGLNGTAFLTPFKNDLAAAAVLWHFMAMNTQGVARSMSTKKQRHFFSSAIC